MNEAAVAGHDLSSSPHELLVDMSVIAQHDAGTGIQRVVRAVFAQLRRLPLRHWVVRPVAASRHHAYRYLPASFPDEPLSVELDTCPIVAGRPGDVFLGLDLASAIMPWHEAQLAEWRVKGVSISVFVYDLLPLTHGEWFRRPARKHFRRWIRLLERQADQVICNAGEVSAQFEKWNRRWWRSRSTRVVPARTLPLSGDIAASVPSRGIPENANAILEWIGQRTTVLMVGTVEPRKGYDQALAAFEVLWKELGDQAPALLVIGRPGWKTKRLQFRLRTLSSFEGPLLWLDDISDEFLEIVYAKVHGLLFASRGEGFGLPVAEALGKGLSILVRDLPVLQAHLVPGTARFSGDRPRDLATAITAWLTAPKADTLTNVGYPARTWETVAFELAAALDLPMALPAAKPGQPLDRKASASGVK